MAYEDAPDPVLSEGEALVRVRACGVNRVDVWVRSGKYKTYVPHILGADVSGEVVKVSKGEPSAKEGDRVVVYPVIGDGTCHFCQMGEPNRCVKVGLLGSALDGGYAEYLRVPASSLIRMGDLDPKVAACLPVNFATAWNGLVSKARVGPADVVLVWGGGSGIGHAAIQVAKLFGAKVVATAGDEEKLSRSRSLGADFTINHNSEDVVGRVREVTGGAGATVVFDHVGSSTWERSVESLAKGGRMVTLGVTTGESSKVDIGKVYRGELSIHGTYAFRREELVAVLKMAAQGRLKPSIFKELPLREAEEAHRILESRRVFGKVLLLP